MEEKIKKILRDEFAYLSLASRGTDTNPRRDEVVQIFARLFNVDMCEAYDKLVLGDEEDT